MELRVVATAGHVDHGKSSLIVRLTGIDPDRWAEEKRRGLTIDLGYAWTTLPGGREIGFVDVPGHERFVRNMLAGVGPVRLVLFVVAADEGWKPQSEEHLQILDVLGVAGGVIALTKRDLVDEETLAIAEAEVRERLSGTALGAAPIVPVSAVTGEGVDEMTAALETMLAGAPAPERTRARLFVDRVFTIKGAGTVATGTLTGDRLSVGDEVELAPSGRRARIRSLQTHKQQEEHAEPVSRVAANLVGTERDDLGRGDVLTAAGAWRPTAEFDARIAPVRGMELPPRGAFKVYAGAAEADARIRLVTAGDDTFARITTSRALILDVGDRFVVREAGRRATVGGGVVLDVAPPRRLKGTRHLEALAARAGSSRDAWPALLVGERGALPLAEVAVLVGAPAPSELVIGGWAVAPAVREAAGDAVLRVLDAHHQAHPLDEGAGLDDARRAVAEACVEAGAPRDASLTETLLNALAADGEIVRTETTVRRSSHRVALEERSEDLGRLLRAIGGEHESLPPTVKQLLSSGTPLEVLEAAARARAVIRIAPDLVVAPSLIERATALVREAEAGITVSTLREALGTSRKYAVPLVEWLDREGITRREGDLRFPR